MNEHHKPKVFVEVSFRTAGQTFLFDTNRLSLKSGARVVCETEQGQAIGTVLAVAEPTQRPPANFQPLRVLREANEDDLRLEALNESRAKHATDYCKELITQHNLPMKLVGAEFVLHGNKLLFYFSAEGRIDFRKLVRELARYFQMRIEMRQIGVRDTAKQLGGLGPCGQELCCSRFLRKFTAVSVRMAKDQNLSLNPQKITGVCGRLMCCLAYEQSTYQAARKVLPRIGAMVMTPTGKGKIRTVHALTRKARVLFLDEKPVREEEYDISQLEGFEDFHEKFDRQEEVEANKIQRDSTKRSHYSVEPLMESRKQGSRKKAPSREQQPPAGDSPKSEKPKKAKPKRKRGKGKKQTPVTETKPTHMPAQPSGKADAESEAKEKKPAKNAAGEAKPTPPPPKAKQKSAPAGDSPKPKSRSRRRRRKPKREGGTSASPSGSKKPSGGEPKG